MKAAGDRWPLPAACVLGLLLGNWCLLTGLGAGLVPLGSAGDGEQAEAAAHAALAQRPEARKVLMVSGGAGGMAREALK